MGGTDCNSKKKEKKKKRPKFDEKYPRKSLPASPSTERVSDSTRTGDGEGGDSPLVKVVMVVMVMIVMDVTAVLAMVK